MGVEIERKFLVDVKKWKPEGDGILIKQGYIPGSGPMLVRVRRQNDKAFLTLKGRTEGVTRLEYEYPIPPGDAEELLALCERPLIEKTRYIERVGQSVWEIDVFAGENEGLVVAEIELGFEGESFTRPIWIGKEVSNDPRYYNSNLAKLPYSMWEKE